MLLLLCCLTCCFSFSLSLLTAFSISSKSFLSKNFLNIFITPVGRWLTKRKKHEKIIINCIGSALGTSAFVGEFSNSWKQEKILSVQVKHIDISDSGLNSDVVYDLSYVIHKDLGEPGAWGIRYGFEFDYGKPGLKNSSGNITYTEFSWS